MSEWHVNIDLLKQEELVVFSSTIFIFIFLPILLQRYFLACKIRLKLSNIVLLLQPDIVIFEVAERRLPNF